MNGQSARRERTTPSVVIVDDNIDHAVIMRTVLSSIAPQAEVTVLTDTYGLERQLLEAPEGAVVLIDRILGDQEAFPVLSAVAGTRADLFIAMLSAALDRTDRDRALEAGAALAVQKPDSLDGWKTLFNGLLARAAGDPDRRDAVA